MGRASDTRSEGRNWQELEEHCEALKSEVEKWQQIAEDAIARVEVYNSGGFTDADALAEKYLDVTAQLADAIAQRDAAVEALQAHEAYCFAGREDDEQLYNIFAHLKARVLSRIQEGSNP